MNKGTGTNSDKPAVNVKVYGVWSCLALRHCCDSAADTKLTRRLPVVGKEKGEGGAL